MIHVPSLSEVFVPATPRSLAIGHNPPTPPSHKRRGQGAPSRGARRSFCRLERASSLCRFSYAKHEPHRCLTSLRTVTGSTPGLLEATRLAVSSAASCATTPHCWAPTAPCRAFASARSIGSQLDTKWAEPVSNGFDWFARGPKSCGSLPFATSSCIGAPLNVGEWSVVALPSRDCDSVRSRPGHGSRRIDIRRIEGVGSRARRS